MPIDQMIVKPMLDPFRNMLKDVEDKGLTGKDVDEMKAKLQRMDALAQENNDLNQFNAQMMQEDLFNKFSQAYGAALSGAAQAASEDGGYDESSLLKTTIDALKDAVKRINDSKEAVKLEGAKNSERDNFSHEALTLFKDQALIKPIEDAITLGESGISFPDFLRTMVEKGLDKAMEGSAVAREGYEYLLGWAQADMRSPHEITMREELIVMFDELADKAAFNVPDSLQVTLADLKICHKHAPDIAMWDAIKNSWENLLFKIDFWIISYCNFAPMIDPWRMAKDPRRAVKKTQDTMPGVFKVHEELFKEYYNLSWDDIFNHPTFLREIEAYRIDYSKQRIDFLRQKVYPCCKPFNHPPKEVIAEAEKMRSDKTETNPERHRCLEKPTAYYNKVFGPGRYEEKFGTIPNTDSNAAPW